MPQALREKESQRHKARERSWMREALNWVSKITTVALEMAVPGIVGRWLDYQLDTRFLSPLGLAFGAVLGLWHLIQMTKGRVGDKRD